MNPVLKKILIWCWWIFLVWFILFTATPEDIKNSWMRP